MNIEIRVPGATHSYLNIHIKNAKRKMYPSDTGNIEQKEKYKQTMCVCLKRLQKYTLWVDSSSTTYLLYLLAGLTYSSCIKVPAHPPTHMHLVLVGHIGRFGLVSANWSPSHRFLHVTASPSARSSRGWLRLPTDTTL